MTIPTVIVNGFDLMWYDYDLSPNDPNPFFFKENPVQYLRNLNAEGWKIYIYFGPTDQEAKQNIIVERDPQKYLSTKAQVIMDLMGDFAEFSMLDDDLPETIADADPSSFVIIDANRQFPWNLARYTPVEIFGLVVPPTPGLVEPLTISRDDIVYNVTPSDIKRGMDVAAYLRMLTENTLWGRNSNRNRNIRIMQIEADKAKNPGKNIIVVWSPIYRYQRREDFSLPGGIQRYLDRPDQDNIPDVTVYIWGY